MSRGDTNDCNGVATPESLCWQGDMNKLRNKPFRSKRLQRREHPMVSGTGHIWRILRSEGRLPGPGRFVNTSPERVLTVLPGASGAAEQLATASTASRCMRFGIRARRSGDNCWHWTRCGTAQRVWRPASPLQSRPESPQEVGLKGQFRRCSTAVSSPSTARRRPTLRRRCNWERAVRLWDPAVRRQIGGAGAPIARPRGNGAPETGWWSASAGRSRSWPPLTSKTPGRDRGTSAPCPGDGSAGALTGAHALDLNHLQPGEKQP